MTDAPPFIPTNGRVLVRQLPYKPSAIIEVVDSDKAVENEGIVVALSPCRFGRKIIRERGKVAGWEHTGATFPHEVKLGDRVFFPGSYQDSDTMTLNGVKHRCLDSWEIVGIMEAPQPEGFENPVTGEIQPDKHPLLITT